MRIIAGEHRGRQLLAPEGDVTRPITDRVKQSLFDILTPRLPEARVLDLFAGTGSMGLECLSRGAAFTQFFEADRSALSRLRRNIDTLKLQARSRVHPGDLFAWFAQEHRPEGSVGPSADLIFLDPPYRFLVERPSHVQQLATHLSAGHLVPTGLLIFRHDVADKLILPAMQVVDERTYGGMQLEFLQPVVSN